MINDIALFAEPVVEVVVAVIAASGTLYPAPDLCSVGKLDGDFGSILPGVEIYEISKFLGTQVTRT